MSTRKIPESIKQYRPGPCTEIKLISGHYYVYMYQSHQLPSGKWGKKTGKCIGKIIPEKGFIPNRNYHLYTGDESQDDITVLEYGQYDLIRDVAKDVYSSLCNLWKTERWWLIIILCLKLNRKLYFASTNQIWVRDIIQWEITII